LIIGNQQSQTSLGDEYFKIVEAWKRMLSDYIGIRVREFRWCQRSTCEALQSLPEHSFDPSTWRIDYGTNIPCTYI